MDSDIPPLEDCSLLIKKKITNLPYIPQNNQNITKEPPKSSGLAKGFFNTRPTKASNTTKTENDIPFIKYAKPTNILPQVSSTQKFGSNSWITPEFIQKVSKSPQLASLITDSYFIDAIQEFIVSPESSYAKFSKTNPEYIQAFKELSSLIGPSVRKNIATASIPEDLPTHEKQLLENVFNNDKAMQILKDSEIQKILSDAQKDPLALNKALKCGNQAIVEKLQVLIQCGLLQMAV